MAFSDFTYLDSLFLALNQPAAAPVLQAAVRFNWESKQLPLPERFLVPLASPEGADIGFIEFRFFATTPVAQARFAAIALHSVRDAKRLSLPRLPALSPLPRAGS